MKRLKWNRKFSILVLIMFITVTFASFNTNLFIDGKAYVRVDRDIRITNIRLLETEYNGYENTNSEYTNRTISTDVSLPRQASSVTYEVTISNVSDKRYKITDIIEDSYDNKDVKYELIDASIGNIVEPHTEKTFKVKFTNNVTVVEEDDVYQTLTYTFDYTGGEQEFVVPFDGDYTLEVWGAQGGTTNENYIGGYGAYAKGTIHLNKNNLLFINVGGQPSANSNGNIAPGGYNGGGQAETQNTADIAGPGGGATHIAFKKGTLNNLKNYTDKIIVVAAGGGGSYYYKSFCSSGGSGGGYIGNNSPWDGYCNGRNPKDGQKATQSSGGGNSSCGLDKNVHFGSFGQGGIIFDQSKNNRWFSGGGGGYYGGGAGYAHGANGGSSYIGNEGLTNKEMYCYNCTESNEIETKTISTDNHSSTPTSEYAKEGNGYAKLIVTRKIEDGSEYDYDYTGSEQTFTVPYTGVYKLEVWGSEGAVSKWGGTAGRGGYSTGLINLSKNDSLFISVGGQSNYNGGGGTEAGGEVGGAKGGGATHIATISGQLKTLSNKLDDILIVAGGGGAAERLIGGSGGGFEGNDGTSSVTYPGYGSGGTQTAGGIGMINNDHNPSRNINGSFGQAGIGTASDSGAGGGGGFYGGGATTYAGAGGGGSGYIGNPRLYEKVMYCYDCKESNNKDTKTISTKSNSSMPKSYQSKLGTGHSRITLVKRTINRTKLTLDFTFEEYLNGSEYTFGYTGDKQVFTVPKTGIYKLETWGAQGGYQYIYGGDYSLKDDLDKSFSAGYSTGLVKLNKSEKIYIYVGGAGGDNDYSRGGSAEGASGGYNGGGDGGNSNFLEDFPGGAGGGGATHIAMKEGLLSELGDSVDSILIASGGSGGYSLYQLNYTSLGAGGGFEGNASVGSNEGYSFNILGGTQSSGYAFGLGQTAIDSVANVATSHAQSGRSGGGGGFYGGYAFQSNGVYSACRPGGGGSGYIGNSLLYDKHMTCYNCQTSDDVETKTISNTCSDSNPTADCSKQGDGFAKITLVEEIPEYTYDYTGDVQEFVAPYKGIYKVELWGASGSKRSDTNTTVAGRGAYTNGLINMNKNEKFYLYVGQNINKSQVASFNGSLSSSGNGGPGGGATDIRLIKGETWSEFSSLKSRIMVAAGGGGDTKNEQYPSASGGGLVGIRTTGESGQCQTPGTQFSGGTENCSGYTPKSNGSFGMGSKTGSTGGSGWFGGAGGFFVYGGGSGGSSFISGHPGCVSITESSTESNISFVNDSNGIACNDSNSVGYNSEGFNMNLNCNKHYSGYTFYNTIMIDGDGHNWDENGVGNTVVGMPTHDGRSTMTGNTGNGYAKITLIEKIDTYNINYDLDGGTLKNKKKTYSTFDDTFTLETPTKEGHTFLGWYGGKNLFNKEKAELDKELVRQDGVSRDKTDWFVSEYIEVKPSTDYYVSASSGKIGQANAFYDENKNFIVNIDAITGKVTSPANAKYMRINGNTTVIDTVMLEESASATEYESYIATPQKSVIIPKGSSGNRIYHAFWRDDSLLCRKATVLHTRTCNAVYESGKRCQGAGHETGSLITYGSLVDGDIKAGDAFDCDVNGDGIFDSDLERFYYLTDLDSNSNYAVLLYSSYVKNGNRTLTNGPIKYYTSEENWHGPLTAYADLPTVEQWSNTSLTNTSRQLYNELGTTISESQNLEIFNYDNRAARFPTYSEIYSACSNSTNHFSTYCEFILQDSSYDGMVTNGNWGFWLETPLSSVNNKVFRIDTHWMSMSSSYTVTSTQFMVKPVIEVPKSKLRY